MARTSRSMVRWSPWARSNPNTRLLAGAALIVLVGLIGQTPKSLFGVQLILPFAALWGAAGWASAGLSIRPMILLCLFGIAQDMSFVSPIGSFMLVNLVTYGAAALVSRTLDVEADPVKAFLVSAFSMGIGFTLMWIMASAKTDYAVSLVPVLLVYIVTLVLFVPVAPLFRLGGRPGERGYLR